MRKYIIVALFLYSCNPVWEDVSNKKTKSIGSANATVQEPSDTQIVTAERALRLRSTPEGQELTTMPNDSEYIVYFCEEHNGTLWAYGSYTDDSGKEWIGYAAARYLSGGCDG